MTVMDIEGSNNKTIEYWREVFNMYMSRDDQSLDALQKLQNNFIKLTFYLPKLTEITYNYKPVYSVSQSFSCCV